MKPATMLALLGMAGCIGCAGGDSSGPLPAADSRIETDDDTETDDAPIDSGVDSTTDAPDDTRSDVPETEIVGDGLDRCLDCMTSRCGSELSKCQVDTICKKQLDCIDACSGAACVSKCQADFPSTLADDLQTCAHTYCIKQCV
jgi:hypothetical protein